MYELLLKELIDVQKSIQVQLERQNKHLEKIATYFDVDCEPDDSIFSLDHFMKCKCDKDEEK
jgi:hypothetical protein